MFLVYTLFWQGQSKAQLVSGLIDFNSGFQASFSQQKSLDMRWYLGIQRSDFQNLRGPHFMFCNVFLNAKKI